ncbi:hypothetical protein Q1695_003688 [Nippostrongylus brasiliensis]|nr:hypothetical protein Q1695_003688 [Nippostrongylus brasiliensis]
MEGMASSTVLNAILVVCDLSSLIATPLLIFLTIRIWKTKLMHFNTRLLLCLHTVFLLVHVVGRAVLHTMDLYMYHSLFKNGCEILRTKEECFFLRLPYNVSTVMCSCSAVFIAIERLTATLHTRNYEKGFKKVGWYLAILQILMTTGLLTIIYSQTILDDTHLYYCQTTSQYNIKYTLYPYLVLIMLQIAAIVVFRVSVVKNQRYSSSRTMANSLSSRYQVEENLWTIRTLSAFVYTVGAFTAAYLIARSAVIFFNHNFTVPVYYALQEGTNLLCIYALLLPVILWCKKKDVRNQIKHIVHQNVNTNYNQVFNVLRSQWDAPPENRVPSPKPKARLTCS